MMNRIWLGLALCAGLLPALTGCSGDYHVYQRASASGFGQDERPAEPAGVAPPDAAAPVEPAGDAAPPVEPAGNADAAAPAQDGSGVAADTGAASPNDRLAAPDPAAAAALPAPAQGGGDPFSPPAAPPAGEASAHDASLARLANAGGPVRLEIPSIGVDAAVEHVGLTAERAMDAPSGFMNVGWYDKGFQPGEAGNAVIAGHLDTSTGGPAVFWDLDKVNAGDEVLVTYANGDRYTFTVEDWEIYDHNAQGPIIDSIFGKSQTSDLNLVTCDGAWDHGAATYSKRLVVFTTLVPEATVWAGVDAAR